MSTLLSADEKKLLLDLARKTINGYVTTSKIPAMTILEENLQQHQGCFVSIKKNGALRGCIGNFTSDKPLWKTVQEMAVAAATRDPRFYPMKAADLDDYSLEVSVLSPLEKISDIEQIQVGTHGIYLEKNFSRGVLLPQVATEHGWDRDTFLAQTCIKAGLKKTDWQEGTDIFIFSAEVFSEQ